MGTVGVVVDTNVLVSALGFGGPPLDTVLRVLQPGYRILVSSDTLDELSRVMEYDRLPFTAEERGRYLDILRREATVVVPGTQPSVIDRDPDDNMFLAVAIEGGADFIVSGDDHLLSLGRYRSIEIVTPAEFLSRTQ